MKLSRCQLCLLALFSVKNWLRLKPKIFIRFIQFFHQVVCRLCARKNASLNLFVNVRDEVQNVFVKGFQSRSWLSVVLKIRERLRRQIRLNGRLVVHDHILQTARSERNHKHVTEQICSQEGNSGSSRSPKWKPNSDISQLWPLWEAVMDTWHVIANVFCHCVKMLLECFDCIVIFLCKISVHVSGFGFTLCIKKRRFKCCIVCTAKHAQVQYKQHNLRGR